MSVNNKRETFSSKFGFLISCVGAALGLGNISVSYTHLILNYLTGGEGSINDIKEGSVIAIAMDGEEDNQKVFAVDIME